MVRAVKVPDYLAKHGTFIAPQSLEKKKKNDDWEAVECYICREFKLICHLLFSGVIV